MLIAPQPGTLKWARGYVPTPHGPVMVSVKNGDVFQLEVNIPPTSKARIEVPRRTAGEVTLNGKSCPATTEGQTLTLDFLESGQHLIESR